MSTESDTAAYLWGRQRAQHTISDWRNQITWDWRIFKGWKERQTPPRKKSRRREKQEVKTNATEDFMFRVPGQRPVGGLVAFRTKVKKKYEGNESTYWARMIAAGWLDSEVAKPPRKKKRCEACERGWASLWCLRCKSLFHTQCIQGLDYKDKKSFGAPKCMAEWDTKEQSQLNPGTLYSQDLRGGGLSMARF
jgi:hypothetical protein